jgi:hypothetical protein
MSSSVSTTIPLSIPTSQFSIDNFKRENFRWNDGTQINFLEVRFCTSFLTAVVDLSLEIAPSEQGVSLSTKSGIKVLVIRVFSA